MHGGDAVRPGRGEGGADQRFMGVLWFFVKKKYRGNHFLFFVADTPYEIKKKIQKIVLPPLNAILFWVGESSMH